MPPVEDVAKAPARAAKGLGSKLKGLPPWAYVMAVGVGGAAIWFGIQRSKTQAEAESDYATGDYNAAGFTATSAGEAYPVGSQGAGYYFDPTTGTTDLDRSAEYFSQFSELLGTILATIPTGGGTQPSAAPADHLTPPQIIVQVPPPPAQPTAPPPPASSPAPKPPDPCKGEYPFLQDNGPRAGQCYKVVLKGGKRYRYYKNGDKVLAP